MRKTVAFLSVVFVCVSTALAQNNTIVFDNQSGEPALVRLIGPTTKKIEVGTGRKGTVTATAGHYYIKVRYGASGKYRYARGEEFEVKETATTTSQTTITLHKVVAGNYDSRPISEAEFVQGSKAPATTIPAGSTIYSLKKKPDEKVSFVVPDGWNDSTGQEWRKHDVVAGDVTEAGKLLGIADGEPVQHSYWADKEGRFQGIYFLLKDGMHGIQRVLFVRMFVPGMGEPKFPPHIQCVYYTFRGTVYSGQPATIKGKAWPAMSKVIEIDHTFTRNEEKTIGGRKCLRADPIVNKVFELGTALGYEKGEKVGAPFWAEWQPKDNYGKNPVARYSEEKDTDKHLYVVGNVVKNAFHITRGGKTYPAGSEIYTFERIEGQVRITHVSELGRVLGYKIGKKL